MPQRSQSLFFEHTADSQDNENTTEEKEVSRKNRKRMNNASKRNRISLFAAATGAKASLLSKQCHVMTLHDERNVVEEKTSDALSTGRLLLASERAITERLLSASEKPISHIFSFLNASDLMTKVLPVCKNWADWSSNAHANMLKCSASSMNPEQPSMMSQKSWNSIHKLFPWARFLAEGGFKKVYRVFNASVGMDEAVAVMYVIVSRLQTIVFMIFPFLT